MRPPFVVSPQQRSSGLREFAQRMLVLLAFIAIGAFLYKTADILLLLFGSVMFSVVLSTASYALSQHAHMRRGLALALVVVLIVLITGGLLVVFGARITQQVGDLTKTIPSSLARVRDWISGYSWGPRLISEVQNANVAAAGGNVLSHALGAVTSLLAALTDVILIFFSGLYLALQPDLYLRGVLSLTPPRYRDRMTEIMDALYDALRHWLLGQLVSMIVVGVLFGVALSLIGVPSPIVLGLIAALSEFVPLVGPVVATIPAVLAALSRGTGTVVWVVLAFLVIQQTESNLLVPMVQRRTVHLPPVLALFATVVFGVMFGVGGLLLAVPLVVVLMVAVKMVYVDDILGGPEDEDDPKLRALVKDEEPENVIPAS